MYQVLIVDDEPIVKIALRSMLDWGALGFHICATASNGEEALEMAGRFHPDLIICDLKMPAMDGIELIRTVRERGMDCEFLVISNYEDFNYVRTALVLGAADYMLKVSISPEELSSQLEKIRKKLDDRLEADRRKQTDVMQESMAHQERHSAWRDFFTHKSYALQDLTAVTGLDPDSLGPLALCQISFDWHAQQLETLPPIDLIRSTLKNALEQFDRRRIIFFSSSNTLLVLPQSELALHQNTIAGLAARISQLFQYYMPLSPSIVYKDGIADLEEARRAYHGFQELLELNFYGAAGLMNASELTAGTSVPDVSYKELASEILSLPSDFCLDYAVNRVSGLLDACQKQNVLPARVIQYFVRFLGELEYRLQDVSAPAHDQIVESAEFMRTAVSKEELERHLQDALQAVFSPAASEACVSGQYSPEVLQSISYIRESYNHKISLASVAEHVGLSSGYLCRIFKEETGVSINAYINNLRMTRAGELLMDKNSYIKEVAVSVGFEDQLYFSRLFKRYYGVTPSEYRSAGHS
ncbi:MAG: AraC family transcriptional regulator [Eubacteriales bacterium]|nr:AraC family transcriptional regulator [Eubacteriales bacterium]